VSNYGHKRNFRKEALFVAFFIYQKTRKMAKNTGFLNVLAAQDEEPNQATSTATTEEEKSALQQLWDLPADEEEESQFEDEFSDLNEDSEEEEGDEGEETDEEEGEGEGEESEEEDADKEESEEEDEEEGQNPLWADRMAELYPDREFKTPQDYDNAVNEHLVFLETQIAERDTAHANLTNIFKQYPQFAAMIQALDAGDSDRVALIKAGYSPEDFVIEAEDDDAEALVEAKINLKKQREAEAKRKIEVQQNITVSQKHLENYRVKNNVPEDEWDGFLDTMSKTVTSFIEGNITPEVIDRFYKGLNTDKIKRKAMEEGEVKGKTAKIIAEKKKRAGDGLPSLSRGTSRTKTAPPRDAFVEGMEKGISRRPASLMEALSRSN
jgi:hypothetical protein